MSRDNGWISSGQSSFQSFRIIAVEFMPLSDPDLYAAEFEKAMRIFYNAAKSSYADGWISSGQSSFQSFRIIAVEFMPLSVK